MNVQISELKLYTHLMVIQAMEVMLKEEKYELPVYDGASLQCLIKFKDIINFLTYKPADNDLLHYKLHFEIGCMLSILSRVN